VNLSITLLLLTLLSPAAVSLGQSAPLTATSHASPLPAGLAPPIAAKLAKGGVRVVAAKGAVTLDFWWVESLPLKSGSTQPSWESVEEGALIGAVNITGDFRDLRGKVLKPGIYTLRYGIQPDNGDHLGVSPFRAFLLLSPAAGDGNPAPAGHEGAVELSKASIGGSHPGVWSIDPPVANEPTLAIHKTSLGHEAVVMEITVTRDGKPAGTLRFGVVLIGTIEA
jgi:hypothetical protein